MIDFGKLLSGCQPPVKDNVEDRGTQSGTATLSASQVLALSRQGRRPVNALKALMVRIVRILRWCLGGLTLPRAIAEACPTRIRYAEEGATITETSGGDLGKFRGEWMKSRESFIDDATKKYRR